MEEVYGTHLTWETRGSILMVGKDIFKARRVLTKI